MGFNVEDRIAPHADAEGSTIVIRGLNHKHSGTGSHFSPSPSLTSAQAAEVWSLSASATDADDWISLLDSESNPYADWLDGMSTADRAGQWASAKAMRTIALLVT